MIFHENLLLADDSHVYHTLFLSKIGKGVAKGVRALRGYFAPLQSQKN